jgi:hypothetical protein
MAHNAVMTLVVIAAPIVTTPGTTIEWHRSQRLYRSPDHCGMSRAEPLPAAATREAAP